MRIHPLLAAVTLTALVVPFAIAVGGVPEDQNLRDLKPKKKVECVPMLKIVDNRINMDTEVIGTIDGASTNATVGETFKWQCQLLPSSANGKSGKILSLADVENLGFELEESDSASSLLTIEGAIMLGNGAIKIPPAGQENKHKKEKKNGQGRGQSASVLDDLFDHGAMRRLQVENYKILVVRVTDSAGTDPTASASELSNEVFGYGSGPGTSPNNPKSQYTACSYGQLKFEEVTTAEWDDSNNGPLAAGTKGVYEVTLPKTIAQYQTDTDNYNDNRDPGDPFLELDDFVREAVTDQLNVEWGTYGFTTYGSGSASTNQYPINPFTHVMYCLPPGAQGEFAYAYINGWLSVYPDTWCEIIGVVMHELGHNLGLRHANEIIQATGEIEEYGDNSGNMGNGIFTDERMCFNAAKSWQLGWYSDRRTTVYPLNAGFTSETVDLVGISDYQNSNGYTVLLKLETGLNMDYYVFFNRKTGINSGTGEGGDLVMLVSQNPTGASKLVAKLNAGGSYPIPDFGESGSDVDITVDRINTDTSPWVASVVVGEYTCTGTTDCESPFNPGGVDFACPLEYSCNSGTGSCEESLPGDCACVSPCPAPGALETTTETTSYWSGNMFKIKALNTIQITGFAIHIHSTGSGTADVYAKMGSYSGFETESSYWTLSQSESVTGAGKGQLVTLPQLPNPILLEANDEMSFQITVSSGDLRDGPGTSEGALCASDTNLQVFEGLSVYLPFGYSLGPYVWSGRIDYNLLPTFFTAWWYQFTNRQYRFWVRNVSPWNRTITEMRITWPEGNGQLWNIKQGGNKISDGTRLDPPSGVFTNWQVDSEENRQIPSGGGQKNYRLRFKNSPIVQVVENYDIVVVFDDGSEITVLSEEPIVD